MSELSDQKRVLIATVLSIAVMAVWYWQFPPARPATPVNSPTAFSSATPADSTPTGAGAGAPAPTIVAAATSSSAVGDTAEKTIIVENGLYRVVFSNRGAVVRSWELKKYTDAN